MKKKSKIMISVGGVRQMYEHAGVDREWDTCTRYLCWPQTFSNYK